MQAEHGEAGEVVSGGEEVEVGVDLAFAADACSSPAVSASHEVPELAFDLGSGGAVVVDPVGVRMKPKIGLLTGSPERRCPQALVENRPAFGIVPGEISAPTRKTPAT